VQQQGVEEGHQEISPVSKQRMSLELVYEGYRELVVWTYVVSTEWVLGERVDGAVVLRGRQSDPGNEVMTHL
jgi:hypothetical protein